jgi:tetratricopeptide (TPR) repeat protein
MITAFLQKIGLSPQQAKILVRVFQISFGVGIAAVGCAWVLQTAAIKMKAKSAGEKAFPMADMQSYFEKKSRDLLPIDIEAHEFMAGNYLKNDQPQKAIDHILRILPLQKGNRQLMLNLATAYLQSGKYQEALERYTSLEQTEVNDELSAAIAARKGLTLFYLGQLRASIDHLQKSVSAFPRCAEALCYLGEVEAATADAPGKVEEYFKKSLSIDSGYVEAWYQLARYCMGKGDYVRSRAYLLKILETEPLHAKTHARLGMAYYYLNEPELAKKSYRTALALNPDDYNTHYNLGELFFTKYDDNASALQEFKLTLAGNPRHGEANFRTGVICLGNNMVKEAVGYLEAARAASPGNIRILLQLGVAYEKLDMKDEALGIYRVIVEQDPLNKVAAQKIKLLSN